MNNRLQTILETVEQILIEQDKKSGKKPGKKSGRYPSWTPTRGMPTEKRAEELIYRMGGLGSAGGRRVLKRLDPSTADEVVKKIRSQEREDWEMRHK